MTHVPMTQTFANLFYSSLDLVLTDFTPTRISLLVHSFLSTGDLAGFLSSHVVRNYIIGYSLQYNMMVVANISVP